MRRTIPHLGVLTILATVLVGCSGGDDAENTPTSTSTSTTAAPVTSLATTLAPPVPTTVSVNPTTIATSTTEADTAVVEFPAYEIVSRSESADGDTLVILIDSDFDDALTDIDLQNLLADVVEMFPPVYEAFVVDSRTAANLVLAEDLDEQAQSVLDQHFLVRLEEGFRVVFTGPFEGTRTLILGS